MSASGNKRKQYHSEVVNERPENEDAGSRVEGITGRGAPRRRLEGTSSVSSAEVDEVTKVFEEVVGSSGNQNRNVWTVTAAKPGSSKSLRREASVKAVNGEGRKDASSTDNFLGQKAARKSSSSNVGLAIKSSVPILIGDQSVNGAAKGSDEAATAAQVIDLTSSESSDEETVESTPTQTAQIPESVQVFAEDVEDVNYKDAPLNTLLCEACYFIFGHRQQFANHHRRHMAPELFQCTTCSLGFTTLELCLKHEVKVHRKTLVTYDIHGSRVNPGSLLPSSSKASEGAAPPLSPSKSKPESDDTAVELNKWWAAGRPDGSSLVSNDILPYRGPPVTDFMDSMSVQVTHGSDNRGTDPLRTKIEKARSTVQFKV